ncbi:ATP-binding domain-containing protein [Pseudenhygromyxa sp. WMMC2535]|uniref:ATP-binding domain-containing protein n=1 Tax=Pseudenhygromyxa sp. WMMC2535 TaxID=2712867 RepID=UPI0015576F86|nr:ATP-binding domain-containing protein [Pseudenhygromyxa sp. WMMC2535]NVB40085.1 ATP-binding domain-containing protein [Pseudenhygromyxa sp. WMMC2535]
MAALARPSLGRPPSPPELARLVELEGLCAALWELKPGAQCLGRLRVRSAGRTRDLLLGGESFVRGGVGMIDWEQAPLAEVFFANEVGDEYEVELDDDHAIEGEVLARELLVVAAGRLAVVDDGELRFVRVESGGDAAVCWRVEPSQLRSPLVPRDSRERDRVSSPIEVELDPVQRGAVELEPGCSLLILGEAGFGKTTVALHRLARLRAQARRERPKPQFRALVLVPTPGLRNLLTALLERLGVDDAEVETFAGWIAAQGRRAFRDLPARDSRDTSLAVSRVKRHPALLELLPRIVAKTEAMRELEAGYRDDERVKIRDDLLHLFGDRALLDELVASSGGELTAGMAAQVIAHTKIQFSPTSEQRYAHVDADRLQTVDGLAIDEATPDQDAESLDVEDFALLFELERLRRGKNPKLARYDHVLLDEGQEFAPVEFAVIGRALAARGSLTLAGDANQQVDETLRFCGWERALDELGVATRTQRVTLKESYRCPPALEDFARRVVDPQAGAGQQSGGVAVDDPALCFTPAAHELDLLARLSAALAELRRRDRLASVAVVCRRAASSRRMYALLERAVDCRLVVDGDFRFTPGISVTCVDAIKGLEFDMVVLPDLNAASYAADAASRRALYVAATRAMSRLWLLWAGRPSPLLQAAGVELDALGRSPGAPRRA